jgi:hypothetical protein
MAKIWSVTYDLPQPNLGINEEVTAHFNSIVSRKLFVDTLHRQGITAVFLSEQKVFEDAGEAVFDLERRLGKK